MTLLTVLTVPLCFYLVMILLLLPLHQIWRNSVLTQMLYDVHNMETFCSGNGLLLNNSKTEILCFSSKENNQSILVKMNNKNIQQNSSVKFLGFHLDAHLTWSIQIEFLLKILATHSFVIWQLRNKVTLDTLKTYYFAYIHSSINYGILCWGNCSRVNDILIIQKKIIRLMLFMSFTASCQELYKQLNILTVPSLYIFNAVTFIKSNPENFIRERTECSRYRGWLNYNIGIPQQRLSLVAKQHCYGYKTF